MDYTKIPDELKAIPAWTVTRPDKKPSNPRTGGNASPTNPKTWTSFDYALTRGDLLGFVLSDNDPYTCIDLDVHNDEESEKADRIIRWFDSYTERSQGGVGAHIFVRGHVKAIKTKFIEMYSTARVMTMTGNVIHDRPIVADQEKLDKLREIVAAGRSEAYDADYEKYVPKTGVRVEDNDVVLHRVATRNGAAFKRLAQGVIEKKSPSEADFALMAMICRETPDDEQAIELFEMAASTDREKYSRPDYLPRTLARVRAITTVALDYSKIERPVHKGKAVDPSLPMPPGRLGKLVQYFLDSSASPTCDISIVGALGLLSGIAGRQYNVGGVGLNQYFLVVAKTGTGKEEMARGIDDIATALRETSPAIDNFMGPSSFASGPGLVRRLETQNSFISVIGEMGFILNAMGNMRNQPMVALKKSLLDIYTKSGWGKRLHMTAYSDSKNNTSIIESPAVSFIGETQPEILYQNTTVTDIANGLLPRMHVIDYRGKRPYLNKHPVRKVPQDISSWLADTIDIVQNMMANRSHVDVEHSAVAEKILDDFYQEMYDLSDNSTDDYAALWTRAHLKALKLSALLAVANDPTSPIVDEASAKWAVEFVRITTGSLAQRFKAGEIGSSDDRRMTDILRVVEEYFEKCPPEFKDMQEKGVIPHAHLARRVYNLVSFKAVTYGTRRALKDAVDACMDMEFLSKVDEDAANTEFGSRAQLYYPINLKRWPTQK